MIHNLFKNRRSVYLERFTATRWVSFGAAIAVIAISVVEVGNIVSGVMYAENLAERVIARAMVTPAAFLATFGVRLVYIAIGKFNLLGNFVTFVMCTACTYVLASLNLSGCVLEGDPHAVFAIYSLFSNFPLEMAGYGFVAIGLLKFVVTSVFVARVANE